MSYLKITPEVITHQIPELAKVKGEWQGADSYELHDIVTWNRQVWAAVNVNGVATQSEPAAGNSDWQLLSLDPSNPGTIGDVSPGSAFFTSLTTNANVVIGAGSHTLAGSLTLEPDAILDADASGVTVYVRTAAPGTDDKQAASTEFVKNAIDASNDASLGSIASQDAGNVNITGGSISGTDVGNVPTFSTSSSGTHTLNGAVTVGGSMDASSATEVLVPTVQDDQNSSQQAASTAFVQNAIDAALGIQGTLGDMAQQNKNAVDIEGGTIENTAIGSATQASGSFTSLYATAELEVDSTTTLNANLAIKAGSGGASKFTVEASSGDTDITGTLDVSGASTLAAVSATNVTASGTLDVTGQSSLGLLDAGNTDITGTLDVSAKSSLAAIDATGNLAIKDGATDKFTVEASSGNTVVAGTLNVTGEVTLLDDATVGGDLTISGNLTVSGQTTTVNTEEILIKDKSITVASNATTDVLADGAGILIGSAGDKSITFSNATKDFDSTQSFDLAANKEFKINGSSVLSSSTLGSGVTASSLTSVGTLTSLDVSGNSSVGGDLEVTGTTNLTGDLTAVNADFTGDVNVDTQPAGTNSTLVASTAYVDGAITTATNSINNTINNLGTMSTQDADSVAITGGSVDGTSIGATTRSTGAFTTLAANNAVSFTSTLGVTGTSTLGAVNAGNTAITGTLSASGATTLSSSLTVNSGTSTFSTVDINGGAIDGTAIGASSASTGAFTTLSASGNASVTGTLGVTGATTLSSSLTVNSGTSTFSTVDINGGNIDGTVIGGTTRAAGSFNALTAHGLLSTKNNAGTQTFYVDNTTGNTTVNGTLTAQGATTLNAATTIYSTLTVTNAALLDNGATVDNNVLEALAGEYVAGTYEYNGISAALLVNGDIRTLNGGGCGIEGNASIGGNLIVNGTTQFNDTVDVGSINVSSAVYTPAVYPYGNVGAVNLAYSNGFYGVTVDSNSGEARISDSNYYGLLRTMNGGLAYELGNGTNIFGADANQVYTSKQLNVFAGINMNNGVISSLAAPANASDAANKAYVDSVASGLDVKGSVRAASEGSNLALSGTPVLDGVQLNSGDRVLVKDQSTQSENGIYVVDSGNWVRATDFDGTYPVTAGAFTFVEEGTVNADSGWVLSTDGTITIGTTPLSFSQFSGAGSIQAGNGLSKNGNTIDVNVGNGLSIIGDALEVNIGTDVQGYDANTTILGNTTTGSGSTIVLSDSPTLTGTTNAVDITASGNVSAGGTLSSTGDFSVGSNTFNVTAANGNTQIDGTLTVDGASSVAAVTASGAVQVNNTLGVTGASTMANITADDVTADSVITPQVRGTFTIQTVGAGNTSYSLTTAESGVLVNTSAGNYTVNLPSSAADGVVFKIKKIVDSGSTNTITIQTPGSETIDGANTKAVSYPNQTVCVLSMNGNWYII